MSIGKYSPTVSMWYANDQNWFRKNGGDCDVLDTDGNWLGYQSYDKDGYDEYGYHRLTELDRAGNYEYEYVRDSINYYNVYGHDGSWIYDNVSADYSKLPAPTCDSVTEINGCYVLMGKEKMSEEKDKFKDYAEKMDTPMEALAIELWGVNPKNPACIHRDDHDIVEIAARKIKLLKSMLLATGFNEKLLQNIMEDV